MGPDTDPVTQARYLPVANWPYLHTIPSHRAADENREILQGQTDHIAGLLTGSNIWLP